MNNSRFVPSVEALGERLAPSTAQLPSEWIYGTELPDVSRHVRYRMFAIVDRTQASSDGVVLLYSSLPGSGAS